MDFIEYITENYECDESDIFTSLFFNEASTSSPPFRNTKLEIHLTDVEDFVKKNEAKEVTNPIFFIRDGIPSPDGLLSYELFGITKEERSNIWGYINLNGWFLHPLCYKLWGRMDSNIKAIVHGTKTFKIDSSGYIVEDPEGETGLDFLYKNIEKIKIKSSDSKKRDKNIDFIYANKSKMFIKKMLVQPPYYRDVLNGKGKVDVGALNKYYASLLISAKSLKETQDFGFSLGDATKGRVQETLLNIYACVTGTSNNPDDGTGLSNKMGIINQAALSKTTDYGTRLVLSAPELKVEALDDIMATLTHCALPLSSAIVNFYPFVLFAMRRFFENAFGVQAVQKVYNKTTNKIVLGRVIDPQIQFSDEVLEHHIKKFVYGFSNRFEPVMVKTEVDGKEYTAPLILTGYHGISSEDYKNKKYAEDKLLQRSMTWCDILFIATVEATKDKHVLITRYPIDSAYNQIPNKINISTTKATEPMVIDNVYYRWYPKITEKDVGSNTSNKFIDTMNICNLHLAGMGGDYDGDTVGVKGCWLQETNDELDKFINSKRFYINFAGTGYKVASNEAFHSIYSLTRILDDDKKKLTNPVF